MLHGNASAAVIAHSGGPTPVINASLVGLVEAARQHGAITRLYGAKFGLPGILNQDFVDLFAQPESLVRQVGESTASALGCSRHEVSNDDLKRVIAVFREHGVGYFFYTGGNGSMGTAWQLQQMAEQENFPLQIVGVPKTIDNDLFGTDHTPGYATTARFFAHAVRDIGADNWSLPNQVEIVEVLGRNAGWLAAATSLAKSNVDDAPHLIYFPENRLPVDKLLDDISRVYQRIRRCVVVVCEGQLDTNGEPFGADVRSGSRGSLAQNLGHTLAKLISSRLGLRARSEKPGLLGRSSLAYVLPQDREEARMCGQQAIRLAAAGKSGVMATLLRNNGPEYGVHVGEVPLQEVAFKERTIPAEWMNAEGTDVGPEFRSYAEPIVGTISKHQYFQAGFVSDGR